MAKVELEGKLTSGFPAMTGTVQVHKRGPRHRQLKWIVENLIRAALVYGVNQALDYLKELIRGQLQRSLGNGGPGKEKSPGYVRAITRLSRPEGHANQVGGCGVDRSDGFLFAEVVRDPVEAACRPTAL